MNPYKLVPAVAVALISVATSSASAQAATTSVEGYTSLSVSDGGSTVEYIPPTLNASSPSTFESTVQVPFKRGRFDQQIVVGRVVLCRIASFKLNQGANTVKCRFRQAALKRIRWKSDGSVKANLKLTITNDAKEAISLMVPVTIKNLL